MSIMNCTRYNFIFINMTLTHRKSFSRVCVYNCHHFFFFTFFFNFVSISIDLEERNFNEFSDKTVGIFLLFRLPLLIPIELSYKYLLSLKIIDSDESQENYRIGTWTIIIIWPRKLISKVIVNEQTYVCPLSMELLFRLLTKERSLCYANCWTYRLMFHNIFISVKPELQLFFKLGAKYGFCIKYLTGH